MIGLRTLKGFPVEIASVGSVYTRVRLCAYADGSLELDKAGHVIGCWEPWERLDCLHRFSTLATQVSRRCGQWQLALPLPSMAIAHGASSSGEPTLNQTGQAYSMTDAERPDAADSPARDSCVQGKPIRVLLVEDHHDTAQALTQLLVFFGYDARAATTAAEALEMSSQQAFDVIISDLTLPDITGHELMQKIRQSSAVPGIALSGLSGNEEADKSRDAGFCDHLVKPIDMDDLHACIQRITAAHSRED